MFKYKPLIVSNLLTYVFPLSQRIKSRYLFWFGAYTTNVPENWNGKCVL